MRKEKENFETKEIKAKKGVDFTPMKPTLK